jgi:hypothetical protein
MFQEVPMRGTTVRFFVSLLLFAGLGFVSPDRATACVDQHECCCGEDSEAARCGFVCLGAGASWAEVSCTYDEDGCITGWTCDCYIEQ